MTVCKVHHQLETIVRSYILNGIIRNIIAVGKIKIKLLFYKLTFI